MKKRDAKDVFAKYLSDAATEQEKALAEGWLLQEPERFTELSDGELLADLNDIHSRVFPVAKSLKRIQLWPRFAAAASIILILSVAGYLMKHKPDKSGISIAHVAPNILPGKSGAILTLADGSKIVLEQTRNGTIGQQSGARLNKANDSSLVYHTNATKNTAAVTYNTLETPRGRQYSVVLPDGTKIWLNSASSIKYPTAFNTLKERKVFLNGEAYFEVAKDKHHPFKVITSTQEVRVLGTHFNVNSYTDEPAVNTTLFEGSVRINNQTVLKPGQKASLYHSGKISVSAGSDNVIAWKNGKFRFEDTSMEEILRELARWYDVDIVYPDGIPQETFSGYIDQGLNLSDALDILKYTRVNFKIAGKKIYVYK